MFTIPPHIGMMSSLKELYINDNPDLQVIHVGVFGIKHFACERDFLFKKT